MNEKEGTEGQHPYHVLIIIPAQIHSYELEVPWTHIQCPYPLKGHWGSVMVIERDGLTKKKKKSNQESLDCVAEREREGLTMCVWRGKMGKEAKRERECRKPLAPCLQSAICWWRGSWRGGAQRPFLAMRSSLINKTKSQLCHSNLLSAPMLKDTVYLHIIQSLWMRAYRRIGGHSWSRPIMELLHKLGRGMPLTLIAEERGIWGE